MLRNGLPENRLSFTPLCALVLLLEYLIASLAVAQRIDHSCFLFPSWWKIASIGLVEEKQVCPKKTERGEKHTYSNLPYN
jgi:hypothetical protein